jgi:excinuclease ABC subunit C
MSVTDKVRQKLRDIPDKPGCYMMRDKRGKIIYVGKAKSLRKRVQWYFREASLRSGNPKVRGLINSIDDLDYLVVRNEAEALLTEGQLIKDYKPRYNITFKDDKRFLLLRANVTAPYPQFRFCRLKRDDNAVYFGPYTSSSAARATLDFLEKRYGLRKCSPRVPDADTYKHCINDVIRFCAAPCIGKVTSVEYHEKFEEACAFLRGERPAVLKEVAEMMEQAAGKMDYEKAAALRDTLSVLKATIRKRGIVKTSPDIRATVAIKGIEQIQEVLHLPAAPEVIECYDISNISGTFSVASMVCAVDGVPKRNRYRRFKIKTVSGIDDPAMMAEVLRRRFGRMQDENTPPPDLVVVDGGITQLRAAYAVLAELGIDYVTCIGLAKRYEEIYSQEQDIPIRLPRNAPALKVLQQLRDEAHRFAITYHRHLRNKTIKDSVLDDIPGIGDTRKKLLLKHFGSVSRIRKASLKDIMDVPGVGTELAELIKRTLDEK